MIRFLAWLKSDAALARFWHPLILIALIANVAIEFPTWEHQTDGDLATWVGRVMEDACR